MSSKHLLAGLLFILMFANSSPAQDEDREDFHVEGSIGPLWISPAGNILSNGNRVDLRSDLGLASNQANLLVRAVFKPTRKNRILFETIPYRLDGNQSLTRSFTFGGVTYSFSDRISSEARINYVFGGYQYDIVSSGNGHAGLLAGVGYVDGKATAKSEARGITGSDSVTLPFPLVGGEFRVFPAGSKGFNFNGELKGLPFGDYGHYFQTLLQAGVGLGSHVTVQAGFSYLNADVHEGGNGGDGLKLNFRGPVISVQFRDR